MCIDGDIEVMLFEIKGDSVWIGVKVFCEICI